MPRPFLVLCVILLGLGITSSVGAGHVVRATSDLALY